MKLINIMWSTSINAFVSCYIQMVAHIDIHADGAPPLYRGM